MTCSKTENSSCTHKFYRLAQDCHCEYGDGGEDFLQYPIWINKSLNLNKCRERLVQALHKLNEQRQDHQNEPSPVEDIIDPDLLICCPQKFDRDAWIEQRKKQCQDSYDAWNFNGQTLEEKIVNEVDKEITEHVKLRSTYQWMPTVFVIDQNGHVTITTDIPQLIRTPENEQLYIDIAQVFETMLPAFQETEIVGQSAQPGNTLQVIVKAQSYNLKAGH
ncbi:unnamed protein product [Rotaria sp. Silwood2]|nr:unnamed protein product [Rotaria sp. Silwood2]CAF2963281.1 unnamed protein product [Rotaria sp. Silwood2]CAF3131537.1 unnamed protein product [Rotaria sp. Silwood2]CAF4258629.1 unnamed protein product [Rotaria sp. Silwood2]CAF4442832.1 unnamed protein product [Rotaria sp. Silwood2]